MYLRKIEINNIRNIEQLVLEFQQPAGWHVFIGDNGAGKSTILRAIAMGLMGPREVLRLDPEWNSWVRKGSDSARIDAFMLRASKTDEPPAISQKNELHFQIKINRRNDNSNDYQITGLGTEIKESESPAYYKGRSFGAGFGAFRRFSGGDPLLDKDLEKITPITPYQTLFREGVALTSTLAWIKDLYARSLERNKNARKTLEGLKALASSKGLLPGMLKIDKINADGIFFIDADNNLLHLNDLSDGVKSVLALTFEMIRLLLQVYSVEDVFGLFSSKEDPLLSGQQSLKEIIPVSGVVLIDEIDAHLHPTWQARIGQWFTKYFPNLQFIVTTHNPIICRAAEKGSIWRLSAPGSGKPTQRVKGIALKRLIYGNILEAYDTELFGENTTSSPKTTEMLEQLARLNKKSIMGTISPEEKAEREELLSILPTKQSLE